MKSIIIAMTLPMLYLCFKLPDLIKLPEKPRKSSLISLPVSEGSRNANVSRNHSLLSWNEDGKTLVSHWQNDRWSQVKDLGLSFQTNWLDQAQFLVFEGAYYGAGRSPEKGSRRIVVYKSLDGETWTDNELDIPVSDTGELGFIKLFAIGGNLHISWIEGYENHSRLVAANLSSKNINKVVLDSKVCDCCPYSVTNINQDSVALAYRDRSDEELRNIRVIKFDSSLKPSEIVLKQNDWHTESCPMNGPSLIRSHEGLSLAWYSILQSKGRVFYAHSSDLNTFQTFNPMDGLQGSSGRVSLTNISEEKVLLSWVGPDENGKGRIWARPITIRGEGGPTFELAGMNLSLKSGYPTLSSNDDKTYITWTSLGRDTVMMRSFNESFFKYGIEELRQEEIAKSRSTVYEDVPLQDLGREQIILGNKKETLLVFWASWCEPCLKEIPLLNRLLKQRPQLQLVSINLDDMENEELQKVSENLGINYSIVPDPKGDLQEFFNVTVLPTAILISKEKSELWRVVGNNTKALKKKLNIELNL